MVLGFAIRVIIGEIARRTTPAMLQGLETTTASFAESTSRHILALIDPARAEPDADRMPPPPPPAPPRARATISLLPAEIKTEIFRELLLLRHGAVEALDLEAALGEVYDLWERDPAFYDRQALFCMNEAVLRPRRQAMHPQVLCVCKEWYEIGQRILVEENVFLALEGSNLFPQNTHKRWKAADLFHRFVNPRVSSVRPILTIKARSPTVWGDLGGAYGRPRAPPHYMLFDATWAPELIRELALTQYELYRPDDTRGMLNLSIDCQVVAAFRSKERADVIKKLWIDEIYPLLTAWIGPVHLCTDDVSIPVSIHDGNDGHLLPAGRAENLLWSIVNRQGRDLARIRQQPLNPNRFMEPMFQVIESFLKDLRSFYLSRKWPTTRRDNFEYECARMRALICLMHLRYCEDDGNDLPMHDTMLESMVLFDLLLGLLVLRNTLPPTFTNLTGFAYRERRAAGQTMLFDARTRVDDFEWEALSSGLIEEPRPLQRSYATIIYVVKCVDATAPPQPIVSLVQKAYALLRPDGVGSDWLRRKCCEVQAIVSECVGPLLSHRDDLRNPYGWTSGIWTDSSNRRKLEVLLVKHWEKTKTDKFGNDDVFAVPRFRSSR